MFYLGLDLGQAQDYSAVAVLERIDVPIGRCKNCGAVNNEIHHLVRHLERLPLGTGYPEVVDRVQELSRSDFLRDKVTMVADYTGVGRPVFDLMRNRRLKVIPITITGGEKENWNEYGGWSLPKRNLISNLQVLLQSKRLRFAEGLPDTQKLIDELLNYQMKVDSVTAHDSYNAREGTHDDLVLALAIAAWYSERFGVSGDPKPVRDELSPLERIGKIL